MNEPVKLGWNRWPLLLESLVASREQRRCLRVLPLPGRRRPEQEFAKMSPPVSRVRLLVGLQRAAQGFGCLGVSMFLKTDQSKHGGYGERIDMLLALQREPRLGH